MHYFALTLFSVDIRAPNDKLSGSSVRYYVLTGNYTVESYLEGGVFSVEEMSLRDNTWVILYAKANASSFIYERRYNGNPCRGATLVGSSVLKVYTNQTRITSDDEADVFPVESNTVLCYMVLHHAPYDQWGKAKFSYEGTSKGDPSVVPSFLHEASLERGGEAMYDILWSAVHCIVVGLHPGLRGFIGHNRGRCHNQVS
jgi:hypothetical protein